MAKNLIIYCYQSKWVGLNKSSILELIDESVSTYDVDQIDVLKEKLDKSIKLTDTLISILYEKNLIDNSDIDSLLSNFINTEKIQDIKIDNSL